jgi:SAM-dependent methyltransferase
MVLRSPQGYPSEKPGTSAEAAARDQEAAASRSRSAYRDRGSSENAATADIVIEISRQLDPAGGYVLVNELEAQSLFSKVQVKGKRLLEIGCGTLPVALAWPESDTPSLLIATDVDVRLLAQARRLEPRPQYVAQSALDPAIRRSAVDLVILNQVLHHLPPDSDLLGALRGLLAPGGQILMMEPNVSCGPAELIKWLLRTVFGMSMEASPYGQFSRATIATLIARADLTVDHEWFVSTLAFPLTGGLGRVKVVPDSRVLFRFLVALDQALSKLLHKSPPLARFFHWRVLYLLSAPR